ncbi:MAG: M23 family metallopeptidase [Myxococcales bacterium]|nr:M23 family metallopeptidase [Myxococcales bacterium]
MRSFCITSLFALLLGVSIGPAHAGTAVAVAEEARSEQATPAPLTVVPVPGKLSSEFGLRSDPVRRKRKRRRRTKIHKGLDFIAQRGTHVHAAGPGVVVKAQVTGGYGRLVIIDHGGGLQTRYAHLQRFKVRRGEQVEAGKVVGHVGSSGRVTGPHLHFEVRQGGIAVPPSDVVKFSVPKCSRSSRGCKSITRPVREKRPNS